MLTSELFQRVLVNPVADHGADELLLVSGYLSQNMVDKHLHFLRRELDVAISLSTIYGMVPKDGIMRTHHDTLCHLANTGPYGSRFQCHYVTQGPPVHTKAYVWLREGVPILAFVGSANYSLTGFGPQQLEALEEAPPEEVLAYYNSTLEQTEPCTLDGIGELLTIYEPPSRPDGEPDEECRLSLLTRNGETPAKSGINWGQRPGREPNQAYLNIPKAIGDSGFFPERGEPFTVETDDGMSFICVRAQDEGKGLHTTQNNSWLGEYFRRRMNLPNGEYVHRADLERYGRTDVGFLKLDDDTYLMDFGVAGDAVREGEGWEP